MTDRKSTADTSEIIVRVWWAWSVCRRLQQE